VSVINIQNIDLHYEVYGDTGRPVVLLHGWGQNTEMMAFIGEFLKSHFIVYNIDFPGFGSSAEPPEPWGSVNYCEFLRAFLQQMNVEDPIFIAHSFGCRVAIQYAYKYKVHRMVLTGAAGIRDERGIDYYLKVYSYKVGKKILSLKPFEKLKDKLTANAGSTDYRNASGVMRGTLVKVVNEDLSDLLPYIDVETLLVFGENDDVTPVEKGRKMEKLMPDAALVIFENDDHFAYINEAARFNLVLDAFLRRDY
jgi:pimeloyl-ACP methyl ester carboxylesterase